jgi:hypothetical protein
MADDDPEEVEAALAHLDELRLELAKLTNDWTIPIVRSYGSGEGGDEDHEDEVMVLEQHGYIQLVARAAAGLTVTYRRGLADGPRKPRMIDDRSRLSKDMNAHVDAALEPGERVIVVIPGSGGSGIAGTDRRVFIWKPSPKPEVLHAYPYVNLSGVASGTDNMRSVRLFGAGLDGRKVTILNFQSHTAAILLAVDPFRRRGLEREAVRRLNELIAESVTHTNASYAEEQEKLQQALPALLAEEAALPCTECGAGVTVASRATGFTCSGCGGSYLLRRCPSCTAPVRYGVSLAGKAIKCFRCGQSAEYPAWDRLPVSAGVYASAVHWNVDDVADADRRQVVGDVWEATGFGGLARGTVCALQFNAKDVAVIAVVAEGKPEVVARVPWSEVRTIEVSGAGAITKSTGGGVIGGGFGAKGFVEGALAATAINALTRRTSTTIQTFVTLNAGAREVMLLNTQLTPDVLRVRLAPAFARLAAARETATPMPTVTAASQPDRLTRLKMLAELRDSGVLNEEEFQSEKARILASD